MEIDRDADFLSFKGSSVSSWKEDQDDFPTRGEEEGSNIKREDDFADLEYWFGSICFRCLLAQDIFDRVTPGCSFLTADSLLSSQFHRFAFQHALATCGDRGFSYDLSDVYARQNQHSTALLVLIGNVVRTRPQEDMREMLDLLRDSIGSKQDDPTCDPPLTDEKRKSAVMADIPMHQMPLDVQGPEADVGRYTSILMGTGDMAGFVPTYNYKHVSTAPPLFKAVVSFRDYVFEGSGRTKQHAKHKASREACSALGLAE